MRSIDRMERCICSQWRVRDQARSRERRAWCARQPSLPALLTSFLCCLRLYSIPHFSAARTSSPPLSPRPKVSQLPGPPPCLPLFLLLRPTLPRRCLCQPPLRPHRCPAPLPRPPLAAIHLIPAPTAATAVAAAVAAALEVPLCL